MLKVNAATLVSNSLIGFSLILLPQIASAQTLNSPILIAQTVVDGLPPAPPPSTAPASGLQTPAVWVPDSGSDRPIESSERYLVLVNGSSPQLLSQIRRIESNAFIQEHEGNQVIQIGLFNDINNAQDQVDLLAAEGINAEIWKVSGAQATNPRLNAGGTAAVIPAPDLVPVTPIPASIPIPVPAPAALSSHHSVAPRQFVADAMTAAPPAISQDETSQDSGGESTPYYVVIPGNSQMMPEIANQVIRLGEGYAIAAMVEEAERPLGGHVRVGPFTSRRSAARWSRYFRNFGMDARVDYRP
jgi:hypothetical protein